MKASFTLLALATAAFAENIIARNSPSEVAYTTTEVAITYTTVCPVTQTRCVLLKNTISIQAITKNIRANLLLVLNRALHIQKRIRQLQL